MRYAHIYSRLMSSPWFVSENTLAGIAHLLESRINSVSNPTEDNVAASVAPSRVESPASVAIISINGVIGKHLSAMETMCGGCDMEQVRADFDDAMSDPAIQSVILSIDSPGGMAIGCHELFTHMISSKTKPLYAYADTICGSAAYYLACAADAIYSAPTAQVGSIGSMLLLRDESAKNAKEGVKFTIIRSGEFKGLGDPSQPISDEGMAALQSVVDQLGAHFRNDVSGSRPSLKAEHMQGLSYLGNQALAFGLVDGIFNDLTDLMNEVAPPVAQTLATSRGGARYVSTQEQARAKAKAAEPAAAVPPMTLNISMPAMTFAAPNITTNVDSRIEKDAIKSEIKTPGTGAKKIIRDEKGTIIGVENVTA